MGACGARYGVLACDLQPGHGGDHRAYYETVDEVLFWRKDETVPALGSVVPAVEPRFESFLDRMTVWEVLEAVVAEWDSDPMSVQCFDLRLVDRARELLAARRKRKEGWNGLA